MNDVHEQVRAWVRRAMEARGLTQAQVARAGEIDETTLRNVLGGRTKPRASTLRAIERGLRVPRNTLDLVLAGEQVDLPPQTDAGVTQARTEWRLAMLEQRVERLEQRLHEAERRGPGVSG